MRIIQLLLLYVCVFVQIRDGGMTLRTLLVNSLNVFHEYSMCWGRPNISRHERITLPCTFMQPII